MTPKAVLWDLDDTLLDTLPGRMTALAHAYEKVVGGKTDPMALWVSHRGGTLEDLGRRLVGDDYQRFASSYRDRYYALERNISAFEGIESVLEACLEVEIPMAVVTSKVAWGATEELSRAGLLRYFRAVVGFDDTDLHKPDPEPIFTAMERICIDDADGILFVGDSPADVWAARNAGCLSVAALWGTLDAELLLDAKPDHTVKSPTEILALIQESRAAP
ncbi:MAG: HAD-IA family hydrolase [Anaerolineaceae bacterium]